MNARNRSQQNGLQQQEVVSSMVPGVVAQPGTEEEIDLRQLLVVFLRRWSIMVAAFVAVVAAGAVYTWMMPAIYKATATILVGSSSGSSGGGEEMPLLADLRALTRSRSVQTQAEIIKSPAIAGEALKDLPEEYQELVDEEEIEVKPLRDTDIIQVSSFSTNPEAAAALANAIVDRHIEANREENRQQAKAAREYVGEQLEKVHKSLVEAQEKLKDFKQANLTIDLEAKSVKLIAQLAEIETDLRSSQVELASTRANLATKEADAISLSGEIIQTQRLADSLSVTTIKSHLVELELERTQLLQEYTPTSPEVRRLAQQIKEAQAQLEYEAVTAIAQDLAPVQAMVWVLEAQVSALESSANRAQGKLARLPEQEYRLAQITINLQVLHQTYNLLNEEYQKLRISEEARLANVRIVSPAQAPESPVRPRKMVNMALATVLGLMLALGLALVVDRLDDRVRTEEDAVMAVGAPVLAHLRMFPEIEELSLEKAEKQSDLLEIFRTLRSNITLSAVDEPLRVLLVTSTQPREGKTVVATNLAIALAMDGKRTVLVDTDLRRPHIHDRMGVSNEAGLSNVAIGERSLKEVLQETHIPNLEVLTCGPIPPNPAEMLNSQAWRDSLAKLKEQVDFIVMDSSPVLMFTDAQVLASMADATLMVVSAPETSRRALAQGTKLLSIVSANLVGIVLNKLERRFGAGSYYYYHYDDYYHDKEGEKKKKRRRRS